jgi:hypothetical protein
MYRHGESGMADVNEGAPGDKAAAEAQSGTYDQAPPVTSSPERAK